VVTILKPQGSRAKRVTIAAFLAASLAAAPVAGQAQERIHVAQNAQEAQLALRIQQLEEQIRTLTGQVEGLQFQLAQMQTLVQKMNEDNEYRFQQLEGGASAAPQGGAGGKTEAAPQSGGVTPSGEAPQTPAQTPPAAAAPQGSIQTLDGNGAAGAANAPVLGADEQPMDDIGLSHDPLLGTGNGVDGAPLQPLPPGSLDVPTTPKAPLDLNRAAGTKATEGDAEAQYAAGYDAIVKGDYSFAEQQFRQYLELYPDSPQAADATNWLGEALLKRRAYGDAAEVLVDGFQKYASSPRAPDILLKLGMALSGADERDTACRTFAEVTKRYTNLTAAFKTRLSEEQAKAQCPPA
jgi:tol-pal system protein YbgF